MSLSISVYVSISLIRFLSLHLAQPCGCICILFYLSLQITKVFGLSFNEWSVFTVFFFFLIDTNFYSNTEIYILAHTHTYTHTPSHTHTHTHTNSQKRSHMQIKKRKYRIHSTFRIDQKLNRFMNI